MWIGDGNLMNECKSLVKKLGLDNDFIFTGYIEEVKIKLIFILNRYLFAGFLEGIAHPDLASFLVI